MSVSSVAKLSLGFLVSLGLIVWIGLSVEWAEVATEFQKVEYLYIVPLLALLYVQFWLRSVRWSYLLTGRRLSNEELLFDGIMIGSLATNILPLRAGELIRPYVVSSASSHTYAQCFLSVVLERFFDLSVVLLFFGAVTLQVPSLDEWVYRGAVLLAGLAGVIFCAILLGALCPRFIEKLLNFLVKLIERAPLGSISTSGASLVRKVGLTFLESTKTVKDLRVLWMIALLSLLVWLATFAFYQVFLFAFGFAIGTSTWFGITIAVIIALAVAAPSAPGFIGVYQTASIAAFTLFGFDKEMGIAYGIVSHLLQYLFVAGVGLWSISRRGMRLKELLQVKQFSVKAI